MEDSINPAYAARLRCQFGGKLFTSSDMISDLNNWVKKNTSGMIDKIADDSMRDVPACLMNAISYEGKWSDHYIRDDITYRKFHNSDGTTKETSMLKISEREYIENDSYTGFVKPYKNAEFSFMALLPKKTSPAGMWIALHKTDFTGAFKSRTKEKVFALLPEFKYSFNVDLISYCKEFGIHELFSDYADFSPLSSKTLKISALLHKSRIEVNRNGTKAAAVTVGLVTAACPPKISRKLVELDRPFVYAIMHNETGLPVFAGIMNSV